MGMPAAAKIALAAASFVFGLVGLALSIALSPLTASLLLIAFLACVVVFLFRLFRRHPVLWCGPRPPARASSRWSASPAKTAPYMGAPSHNGPIRPAKRWRRGNRAGRRRRRPHAPAQQAAQTGHFVPHVTECCKIYV